MTHGRWLRCACVALVGSVVLGGMSVAAGASAVEELTKRLPDGVLGFVATSGGGVLQEDFAKTALGKIGNDPGVREFCQSIKTELLAKAKEKAKDPNATQMADLVTRYAQLLLGRPLLVGVAQTEVKVGPPVCAFALVDAGDRKADLVAAVNKLEAMAGAGMVVDTEVGSLKLRGLKDKSLPLSWGWVENYLVIGLNDVQGVVTKYVASPRAAAGPFLNKVPAHGDALVAWFDYQKLNALFTASVLKDADKDKANMTTALLKMSGLNDIKTLTARIGFAGPDLVSQALVEMPTPPTGVFAAYKPIDPAWFGAVDIRAVTATAINFDVAGLYDTFLNILKTASPDEGYLQARKAIVDFESDAKLRIRDGLLASLAGPALFYALPAGPMVEAPRGGFVIVAKLKDSSLFEKNLSALGEFAGAKAKGSLQISSRTRDDGRTVHVWAVAPLAMLSIMPAWSIANDHVVIGSTVELCDLGAKQLVSKGADGKSLLDAEGYKKIAADLPKNLVSLTYTDSQVQLNQTMMPLQQFWPMATMLAMQAGVKLPVMLPSLTEIAKDLGPSFSYRCFDADGLRVYYRGSGIEASEGAIVGAAVGAGVALPAVAKAREQARNAASMSHLKQIGLGLIMYKEDHGGEWPADLEQAKSYLGKSQVLESPLKPKDFAGPSYVYVSGQPKTIDPHNVLAYENPAYLTDKINVLFADGHVEAMKPEAFRRELQATYERLGKEMPEIRFKGETESKPRPPRPPRPGRPAQT